MTMKHNLIIHLVFQNFLYPYLFLPVLLFFIFLDPLCARYIVAIHIEGISVACCTAETEPSGIPLVLSH